MASRRARAKAALSALAVALTVGGCVSMPSGGPVRPYSITQSVGGQPQNYPQIYPPPPGNGWTPEQIVQGFITASAAFGDRQQVANQYLTPEASRHWMPSWGAIVYRTGPDVGPRQVTKRDAHGKPTQATVTISGEVQANLTSHGSYVVPSASAPEGVPGGPQVFTLVTRAGQWRISSAPKQLLLNSVLFQDDYQLRNLYFFDPNGRVLVPDPVYVPLQATSAALLDGLVDDLISPPPNDWLTNAGATKTAFAPGTRRIGDVTLDGGAATVNLGGAIGKAPSQVLRQVYAQLYWTLTGTGQGGPPVQSVQVNLNGKPWSPPEAQENPVQPPSDFNPATGATRTFYYVDRAGYLVRRDGVSAKPARITKVGSKVTQLAVSPDGQSVALLRGDTLFTGPIAGKLVRQLGSGYLSVSWDPEGNLWAAENDQIVMLPGAGRAGGAAGQPRQRLGVTVTSPEGRVLGPFTALRIAPDGVRVALVSNGTSLGFGAISGPSATAQGKPEIVLSPFFVSGTATFTAVSWYGPDNVVTLGDQGPQQPPVVTEYPVSGGTPTNIQGETGMTTLTVSDNNALVAGLKNGGLLTDGSLTGAWTQLADSEDGTLPAYPG